MTELDQRLRSGDLDAAAEDLEVQYVKKQIQLLLYRLRLLPRERRTRLQGELIEDLLEQAASIDTPRGPISFVPMGRVGAARGLRLLTKQPATITWIDGFAPNSVFWDIGANVGAYSLYAALRPDASVVAFEPAAVNYFLLTANCELNRVQDRVRCLLAGLGAESGIADLAVSQFAAAGSFGFGGRKAEVFAGRQAAMMVTIDQLVESYGLPCPNYMKIDVPILTEAVLAGGARTLARRDLRELHLEARESSAGGRRVIELLRRSGFVISGREEHGSTDLTFVRA
ncbi:MAG TPA: FkbM family methyltransferase [Vicinamibacterales bacterium]|nr:FkbM family methyltransferase [Vicinamibacterales bacterium]